jgi:hypothetical protein
MDRLPDPQFCAKDITFWDRNLIRGADVTVKKIPTTFKIILLKKI